MTRLLGTVDDDFYIRFKTKDGQLVMDRKTGSDLFLTTLPSGYFVGFNDEFIKLVLDRDSRTKGVRITSQTITRQGIDAIVEWLK